MKRSRVIVYIAVAAVIAAIVIPVPKTIPKPELNYMVYPVYALREYGFIIPWNSTYEPYVYDTHAFKVTLSKTLPANFTNNYTNVKFGTYNVTIDPDGTIHGLDNSSSVIIVANRLVYFGTDTKRLGYYFTLTNLSLTANSSVTFRAELNTQLGTISYAKAVYVPAPYANKSDILVMWYKTTYYNYTSSYTSYTYLRVSVEIRGVFTWKPSYTNYGIYSQKYQFSVQYGQSANYTIWGDNSTAIVGAYESASTGELVEKYKLSKAMSDIDSVSVPVNLTVESRRIPGYFVAYYTGVFFGRPLAIGNSSIPVTSGKLLYVTVTKDYSSDTIIVEKGSSWHKIEPCNVTTYELYRADDTHFVLYSDNDIFTGKIRIPFYEIKPVTEWRPWWAW